MFQHFLGVLNILKYNANKHRIDPPGNIKRPIKYAINLAFGTFLTSLLSNSNFSLKIE
jgi:hypothetical protein|tara:strand:+ start:1465 stop:1638 length:174 start_codon:yes stop_codon:yes gene_type:complete